VGGALYVKWLESRILIDRFVCIESLVQTNTTPCTVSHITSDQLALLWQSHNHNRRRHLYSERTNHKMQMTFYEGHSINKLQNCIIFVTVKIWKIRNIHSVGNFILSTSCECYYDDVISVMSTVLRTQSVSAVVEHQSTVFSQNSPSVKQHCELQQNKQVQQANLFKSQTLLFSFQHIVQIHTNTVPSINKFVNAWCKNWWLQPGHCSSAKHS